ncbi:MAG: hypothetical protein MJZ68_06660 [archaeon]|nr:hypothetical protein [archaeon]
MTRFLCPFCSGDPGKEGNVCGSCSRPLVHDRRMRDTVSTGIDPRRFIGIAERALESDDLETAERACDTVLFTHPRNTHAWFFKGMVDIRTGFPTAAVDCWARSVLLSTDIAFIEKVRDVSVREAVRENIRLMKEGRYIHGINLLSDAFVRRTGVGIAEDVRDGTRIADVPKDVLESFVSEIEGDRVRPLRMSGKEFEKELSEVSDDDRPYIMAGYFSGESPMDHSPATLCGICDGNDIVKAVDLISSSKNERSVMGFMGLACLLADTVHLVDDATQLTKCLSAVTRYAAAVGPYTERVVESAIKETVEPFDILLKAMGGTEGGSEDVYRRKGLFEALCMACMRSDTDTAKRFAKEYSDLFGRRKKKH